MNAFLYSAVFSSIVVSWDKENARNEIIVGIKQPQYALQNKKRPTSILIIVQVNQYFESSLEGCK